MSKNSTNLKSWLEAYINLHKLSDDKQACIKYLKENNISVNKQCSRENFTFLSKAVLDENVELVRVLLDIPDIELEKENSRGQTALFISIQNKIFSNNGKQIFKLLIAAGANVNCICSTDGKPENRISLLGCAVIQKNIFALKTLLGTKEIQVDAACNKRKVTALHLASSDHNTEFMQLLLNEKADPNFLNCHSAHALHFACDLTDDKNNVFESCKLLLAHKANPVIYDENKTAPLGTLLFTAVETDLLKEIIKIIKLFLNHGIDLYQPVFKERNFLDIIITKKMNSILSLLLDSDLKIDYSRASNKNSNPLIQAIKSSNNKAMEFLIKKFGKKIVNTAIEGGCTRRLLEQDHSLKPFIIREFDYRPSDLSQKVIAQDFISEFAKVPSKLPESFQQLEISVMSNVTPLMLTVQENDNLATKLLLNNGANPTISVISTGQNAMHFACIKNSDLCCIQLLCGDHQENYQLLSAKDHVGATPLHLACANGHSNLVKKLLNFILINLPLYSQELLNSRIHDGSTMISLATQYQRHEIMRELIKAGVDFKLPRKDNLNPINFTLRNADKEGFEILLQAYRNKHPEMFPDDIQSIFKFRVINSFNGRLMSHLDIDIKLIEKFNAPENSITVTTDDDKGPVKSGRGFLVELFGSEGAKEILEQQKFENSKLRLAENRNFLFPAVTGNNSSPNEKFISFFNGNFFLDQQLQDKYKLDKTPNCFYLFYPCDKSFNNCPEAVYNKFQNFTHSPVHEAANDNEQGIKNCDLGAQVILQLYKKDQEVGIVNGNINKEFKLTSPYIDRTLAVEIKSDDEKHTLYLGFHFLEKGFHSTSKKQEYKNKTLVAHLDLDNFNQAFNNSKAEISYKDDSPKLK